MNILFIGDIVGEVGRRVVYKEIERLTSQIPIDFIIANGENATHGKGLIESHFNELLDDGIDVVTLGNHYAAKKEIFSYIESYDSILRPNNLHHTIPGSGSEVFDCNGVRIRVTNLLGRVYMGQQVNNPFDNLQDVCALQDFDIHIVDFHAEATGEKYALGYAFDGKVSAVLGTHTHVQTRDNRILPNGTAFISDVGMCGPYNSILGSKKEEVISRTWMGTPSVFTIEEKDDAIFCAVLMNFDDNTHKCRSIEPIYEIIKEEDL